MQTTSIKNKERYHIMGQKDKVVNDTPIMGMTISKFVRERKRKRREMREKSRRETERREMREKSRRERERRERIRKSDRASALNDWERKSEKGKGRITI